MTDIVNTPAAHPAPTTPRRRRDRAMLVRRLGALVLAIAAALVMVVLAPHDSVTASDISNVMIEDTLNQGRAEGAPQQSVVNGWTARDLLELTATQGVEARDHRPAALLALLVLGLCLGLATAPSNAPAPPTTSVTRSPDQPVMTS